MYFPTLLRRDLRGRGQVVAHDARAVSQRDHVGRAYHAQKGVDLYRSISGDEGGAGACAGCVLGVSGEWSALVKG